MCLSLPAVQVCIYRNSVRRALKGIAHALEDLDGSQAGAAETGQVCQAVITVVTQIAQSLHQLQLVRAACQHAYCTPCCAKWQPLLPDCPAFVTFCTGLGPDRAQCARSY